MSNTVKKGYKVTDKNFQCRGFQFELNKIFTEIGKPKLCNNGFHFCEKAQHCFNYYSFTPENRVFEVVAHDEVITDQEGKSCTCKIEFVRELTWDEVLKVANDGLNNTGHSNSGDSNSGNWNSGNWNSGYRNSGDSNSGYRNSGNSNSGDSNSGYRNSGYRNSGDSNSGNRNSGNWNSGNRNSGDSNSGYRNSGAFCTDLDPILYLFNKPCKKMTVRDWENSKAVELMYKIDPTIFVQSEIMTDEEKAANPKHETIGGYLKTISMKEAWANFWGNLSEENRKVFTDLENFDPAIFEEITGIKV